MRTTQCILTLISNLSPVSSLLQSITLEAVIGSRDLAQRLDCVVLGELVLSIGEQPCVCKMSSSMENKPIGRSVSDRPKIPRT